MRACALSSETQPTTVDAIVDQLGDAANPNLWKPRLHQFIAIDALPLPGTGKLDLKGLQQLAKEPGGWVGGSCAVSSGAQELGMFIVDCAPDRFPEPFPGGKPHDANTEFPLLWRRNYSV